MQYTTSDALCALCRVFPWRMHGLAALCFVALALVVSVLTLHRTYYLVDVMLLYTVLFLVAPMAFVLLDRGKSRIILFGSVLLWGLFQFFPEYAALPWPVAGNYLFDFAAWQLLFFIGLLIGYHQTSMPALSAR